MSIPLNSQHIRRLLPRGVSYYSPLDCLTHEEFVCIVARHGGRYVPYSNHAAMGLLVLGEGDLPVTPAGDPIDFRGRTVVAEGEFLALLNERRADPCDQSFTVGALAELLVVPEARVRAWVKVGLLSPRVIEHGVMRFDFRQAAIARTLVGHTDAGVSVQRLRRSIETLRNCLPDLEAPLQQLAILEKNGPLLVRLETGELSEVDGQMQLDYDGAHLPAPEPLRLFPAPHPRTAVDWHALGVRQERDGMLADAEESYRQALRAGGPDAQVVFDLAHVLAGAGRTDAAVERYRQVVELEPDRTDAWNNLGVLLADCGDANGAADAFRRAVRLDPDDAMARYNLADTLDTLGAADEAAVHYREYLRLEPIASPWAAHARERVTAVRGNAASRGQ